MANSKPKFQTQLGAVKYVYLNRPDTEFKVDGEYKCQISQPKEYAKKLIKMCEDQMKEDGIDKGKKTQKPWQNGAGEDLLDDEGNHIFKIKSSYIPKFYNKDGQPINYSNIPNIWAGSTLRLGGLVSTYKNTGNQGVSLLLTKVQISKLVESGSDEGFDAVDGEYIGDLDEGFDDEVDEAQRF